MNRVAHVWQKIPVLIRAIAGGLFVQIVGFAILLATLPLNFRILPVIPWALLPLGLALWAYWSYFGGSGWPRGTAEQRRRLRRSNPAPSKLRVPVIVAGSLFSLSLIAIAILQYSLKEMPREALGLAMELSRPPLWTSIPLAIAAALFVGVGEELSFRGYMQLPIENRHGPWLGLSVPALVFALSHGIDPMILPVFFVVSLGWGFLAWSVNSIRPGIVFHAAIDGFFFIWAIIGPERLQGIVEYSIIDNGLTSGYRLLVAITIVLSFCTLASFVVLHRRARSIASVGGSGAPESG
jgi:membrane protease YdiL (CAAX protease family)